MALATTSKKMREEATCPICLQLMAEPMVISCGHSYCQACLLSFMGPASSPLRQQGRETFSCPQCRAPFQRGSLRPNKQLGNLIAALRELELEQEQELELEQEQKEEQELFCQEHGERLLLFCEEDGQLICWRCERGLRHKGHATSLVEDAGPGYQEKLQEAVRKLRQLEEECASQKAFTAKQIAEWNEKIEARRQKIQEDFQNLHSCLSGEKRYLQILESKKEHTLRKLREREAKLEQQSRDLESRILELEERCQGSAQKMLQDVKAALSRSQAVQLETQEVLSLEVQTECEVTELYFDPIEWLRSHQGPGKDGLPLFLLVWDFLNHLTRLPGSRETDMKQFAETLRGRLTTDEALEELVDVLYEQATSVPRFRGVGAHLCYYLSFHPTVSSPRSNFSQVFSQRLQTEHDLRYQAANGDEAARKQFHGFVLFLGELYLRVKIEGAQAQRTAAHLRGLLDVLLSNPVDDNLVCAVQLLNVTGLMKEQGKKDMEEVIQRVVNVALDTPCSADVRQMVLEFVQLWSSNWGWRDSGSRNSASGTNSVQGSETSDAGGLPPGHQGRLSPEVHGLAQHPGLHVLAAVLQGGRGRGHGLGPGRVPNSVQGSETSDTAGLPPGCRGPLSPEVHGLAQHPGLHLLAAVLQGGRGRGRGLGRGRVPGERAEARGDFAEA